MVNSTVVALLAEPAEQYIVVRQYFYIDAPARNGSVVRTQAGGVFLHEPTAAILLPSDFPPLSRRRPESASLRPARFRFSFMLAVCRHGIGTSRPRSRSRSTTR